MAIPKKKMKKAWAEHGFASLNDLVQHPRNPRKHSTTNLESIKQSLKEFGQVSPIVVNEQNQILAGNGRFQAMQEMKWTANVRILRVSGLSLDQQIAYMMADNKTSDTSEFDFQEVASLLQELQEHNFNLEATGFADFELDPLLGADWQPDASISDDDADEASSAHVVKFTEEEASLIMRHAKEGDNLHAVILRLVKEGLRPRRKEG